MQWEHEVFTAAHIHANPASEHPAFTIPGVTELNVMHDMLHVADVNGVSAHFCGTALFTFVSSYHPAWPRAGFAAAAEVVNEKWQRFAAAVDPNLRLPPIKLAWRNAGANLDARIRKACGL